jgi:fucose permease
VVVSSLSIRIPAFVVTLVAPALMTVTTYFMLSLRSNVAITIAVFCAGLSMAPVFPTVLAIVADAFSRGTATAMGIVLTSGWLGLAVSSPAIGALAKGNNYHRALLLVPSFSALMVLVNVVLRSIIRRQTAV